MKNKRIFCVQSYCNTPEKLDVLYKNLLHLKKYNYPILLHSYLSLPDFIVEIVDYLIIDKDNPIIEKGEKVLWWWKTYKNYRINRSWDDTSWTAINQIKQISNFLSNEDYDYHIFLNYDLIMSPDKFQERLIEENNSFSGSTLSGDLDRTSLLFFILNKADLKFFASNLSLEDYLSKKDGRMAEDYFHDKVMQRGILFEPNIRFSDSIQGFFGNWHEDRVFNGLYDRKIEDFKLFFGKDNILLYESKKDCEVEIIANNINYNINSSIYRLYFIFF